MVKFTLNYFRKSAFNLLNKCHTFLIFTLSFQFQKSEFYFKPFLMLTCVFKWKAHCFNFYAIINIIILSYCYIVIPYFCKILYRWYSWLSLSGFNFGLQLCRELLPVVWKPLRRLSDRDDWYDEFDPWISGKSITFARNPRGGDFAGKLEDIALKTDFV